MVGYHSSVLLREVLAALKVERGKWYLDCTLGDGGHTLGILKLGGKVVGIDVDPQALKRAEERLQGAGYSEQDFILLRGNFRDIKNLLKQSHFVRHRRTSRDKQMDADGLKYVGAIFDLGVSSLQLESPARGFSFGKVGPLDMKMDPALSVRALDLVNGLNKGELYELFNRLGEEKYSRSLAEAVVSARALKPIQTTRELAELAEKVVGGKSGKIHPATKIFQALRIAVNDELNALKEGLDQVKDLVEYGYICVTSFHSLEDRIVKTTFRNWEHEGVGQKVTKKPTTSSDREVAENPRSRSGKLRVFQVYDYY